MAAVERGVHGANILHVFDGYGGVVWFCSGPGSDDLRILVCEEEQVEVDIDPSEKVILVTVPQPSVAVAVPSAAVISEAAGLHASVNVVPVAVIPGGTRSLVHVTVREAVDVLPQASLAVNVLVCD